MTNTLFMLLLISLAAGCAGTAMTNGILKGPHRLAQKELAYAGGAFGKAARDAGRFLKM